MAGEGGCASRASAVHPSVGLFNRVVAHMTQPSTQEVADAFGMRRKSSGATNAPLQVKEATPTRRKESEVRASMRRDAGGPTCYIAFHLLRSISMRGQP